MKVFDYKDYRGYLGAWIELRQERGRGGIGNLAQAINVHSSFVSQIMSKKRDLSPDQAMKLTVFWQFNKRETEYFLLLVDSARAATPELRGFLKAKIQDFISESEQVKAHIQYDVELPEATKAIFYSSWLYSAARILASIPEHSTTENIAKRLEITRPAAKEVVDFLLQIGLCAEKNGKLVAGTKRTHLPADSRLVACHHTNWRIRALNRIPTISPSELSFTFPMSLSEGGLTKIRKHALKFIDEANKIVADSPCELAACLNVDLFRW